jgi:uncharacterized protein YcaQ
VSRRAVAALYLERQWLDRPRGRRLTARTLADFVAQACGLQIDSVNVVDRAHHVTLWSRFGPYDRRRLERLTYRDRVLFEYLTHVACFVATRDLALHKAVMEETPQRFDYWHRGWRKRNAETLEQVARAVAERGPIGNADFERPGPRKGAGWWSWKPATYALDYLWKAGRIGVHSRVHFHKRYDAMARVLPAYERIAAIPLEQVRRERLLRTLSALGAASWDDVLRYWTWPQWKAPGQRATLRELIAEGAVREVRVEGAHQPWFARAEDLPALQRAHRRHAPSRGTTLLSPFDSFLWHRERVHRLWGYFYRIEIYVPGHKRKHGYYCLPLLHDGQLLGRVDLKTHREVGVLEARHVHLEPWFASGKAPPRLDWGAVDQDAALAGLAGALRSLAKHVGVGDVKLGRVSPTRLRPVLLRSLRHAGEPREREAIADGT